MKNLFVFDEVVHPDHCSLIISRFERAAETEVELTKDGENGQYGEVAVAKNPEENNRLKYIDQYGRTLYNFSYEDNPDFKYIMNKVVEFLPKGPDFYKVNFAQIIHYPTGSFMPIHKDQADKNDSATALIMLNDGFRGGKLWVDGHTIYSGTGTIVAFNGSQDRFHYVEPIFAGDRYVLAIWFGPEPIDNDGEGDELEQFTEHMDETVEVEQEEKPKASKEFSAFITN
jgi:hypothetical protein